MTQHAQSDSPVSLWADTAPAAPATSSAAEPVAPPAAKPERTPAAKKPPDPLDLDAERVLAAIDRKSTRLNSSH